VVESVQGGRGHLRPGSGVVTAINEALGDAPQAINADAYGTWLFRLKPDDPRSSARWLDANGYAEQLASEEH